MIYQRLIQLHKKNIRNIRYVKYTQNHLLNYYDELHQLNIFENQIIDMYFERTTFCSIKKRKTKIKINENFDVNVNEFNNDENDENKTFNEKNEQKTLNEFNEQYQNNMKYQ